MRTEKKVRMSIYDITGKVKLCELYDSQNLVYGEAENIEFITERNGNKSISFEQKKYQVDGEVNFRCEYLVNENTIKTVVDGYTDWYIITEPTQKHNGMKLLYSVHCAHLSDELKTRNLFGYFDEENGIGKCQELIGKALSGTGWSLYSCDTLYESDNVTEKIRSYTCNEKTGAAKIISEVCTLFQAYPIYHGEGRLIEIHALSNHPSLAEITYGKNTANLEKKPNSSSIVTRLYVQGDYTDYGYVGIDDAKKNTSGLNFICNFDYYKKIGAFTSVHQAALDTFLSQKSSITKNVSNKTTELLKLTREFGDLISTYPVTYRKITNSVMSIYATVNNPTKEQQALNPGDEVALVTMDATDPSKVKEYRYEKIPENGEFTGFAYDNVDYVVKFAITINGKLMTAENFKNVSDNMLTNDQEDSNPIEGDLTQQRSKYQALMNQYMGEGIILAKRVNDKEAEVEEAKDSGSGIEALFAIQMGGMLREGYWSNSQYIPGQEDALYEDALKISEQMAFPSNSWSVQIQDLINADDIWFVTNQMVRIFDYEMNEKAYGYVDKVTFHPREHWKDGITITTDELNLSAKSLDNILSRITDAANLYDQERTVYKRAQSIGSDGTIPMQLLQGSIDLAKNTIMSQGSSWHTDENGNIMFVSDDGNKAMMLTGMGFMIADSRVNGEWQWRTFGTGDGFTADLITAGFLSADRIQANSMTVDKLESDAGSKLDISSNISIDMLAGNIGTASSLAQNALNRIDEFTVGGVNLLSNSDEVTIVGTDTNNYWLAYDNLSRNTRYTLSVRRSELVTEGIAKPDGYDWEVVAVSSNTQIEDVIIAHGSFDILYGLQKATFDTSDDYANFQLRIYPGHKGNTSGVTLRLIRVKLEEGSVATTWTQSEDDLEKQIAETASSLCVLQNGFESAVQSQIVNSVTGKTVQQYTNWLRFVGSGEDPYLEIGSTINEDMRMRLSKSKLAFIQNGVELAYFSNNKLYITNVQATTRLTIGTNANGFLHISTTPEGVGFTWENGVE